MEEKGGRPPTPLRSCLTYSIFSDKYDKVSDLSLSLSFFLSSFLSFFSSLHPRVCWRVCRRVFYFVVEAVLVLLLLLSLSVYWIFSSFFSEFVVFFVLILILVAAFCGRRGSPRFSSSSAPVTNRVERQSTTKIETKKTQNKKNGGRQNGGTKPNKSVFFWERRLRFFSGGGLGVKFLFLVLSGQLRRFIFFFFFPFSLLSLLLL